ncbi:MAG: 4-hydroxy-tetrahydrodipicolinate reductase [Dethiobacteria bacterium]
MTTIRVAVCGASGNMGREAVKAIRGQDNLQLVGALDIKDSGKDVGLLIGNRPLGVEISSELEPMLCTSGAEVMVDFTAPAAVMEHIFTALKNKVPPVVGTTGLTEPDLEQIAAWVDKFETGAIIAPNFALGAVLMMKFSRIAARYFDQVEIIELHHEHKIDAPSGTAIKTAQMIDAEQKEDAARIRRARESSRPEEIEKISGARGGRYENIHIHSVRLPGMVAHQEVIFGGNGQTLSIRHDSMDRRSFMPGLLMAINRAPRLKKLIYGMENLIDF